MPRVWDRFLSEQDKAHLAIVGEGRKIGWGPRPALLLIDNYRGVVGYEQEELLEAATANKSAVGMAGWRVPMRAAEYAIVDEVAPTEHEFTLAKVAPSAFWGTPLIALLNFLDVDTLVVGGESTSGCMRASVVDAVSYRFRVVIAEECVYDRHEACHAINLFDMNQKYADVLPLQEVLHRLQSAHAVPRASAANEVLH